MAPYAMDLRTRVLRGWDPGMKAGATEDKYLREDDRKH
jgi:hypothetical protein